MWKNAEETNERTLSTTLKLPDRVRTAIIIPKSKETYFNTQWKSKTAPLCAYDMLYHPPDYNPKAARSDRQEPQIIRKNIWDQEFHKDIPSTTHLTHGRPSIPIADRPTKQFVRVVVMMQTWTNLDWTNCTSKVEEKFFLKKNNLKPSQKKKQLPEFDWKVRNRY